MPVLRGSFKTVSYIPPSWSRCNAIVWYNCS